jgi:FKBP-type peptidyl-prolyl cis-trans isomerase
MLRTFFLIIQCALFPRSTYAFSMIVSSVNHGHRPRPVLWSRTRDGSTENCVEEEDVADSLTSVAIRRRSLIAASLSSTACLLLLPTQLALAKDLKENYLQGTAALSTPEGTNNGAGPPPVEYQKLPSGVIYADMRPGTASSESVQPGSRVNLQWVLRKSNGYFVDSSATNDSVPFIFTVGDQTAIAGLDEGVRGMKVNGVRRLLIPPSLAYTQGVDVGSPGPLPVGYGPKQQIRRIQELRKDVPGEYLYLEVQLTRLR